jgi:uncharacterized protein YndB with AHSA1/START domain
MDKTPFSVTVSRHVAASPDALYAAWTDPASMAGWMGRVVVASAQVGGRYRIEHQAGDGQIYVHKGEYRALERGSRIVQTFSAGPADREPPGWAAPNEEYVEVRFRPLDAENTEIMLINSWNGAPPAPEDLEAIEAAWSHWLELLDRHIGAGA